MICELKLGKIYEEYGATLLPNSLVGPLAGENICDIYEDGVSFCRNNDRYFSRKVVVLLQSLTTYEKVFNAINRFDLCIESKKEAIRFIQQFNAWAIGEIDNVDIFMEWYDALDIAGYYLSIDSTLNDKCLEQLCHYYQCTDEYVRHRLIDVPECYLRTIVDDYGGCYSNKRVLHLDKGRFNSKEYAIRSGVEQIDDDVFLDCKELEWLFLPDTLLKIGMNAFSFCYKLEELILLDNVNYIGECLCENCKSLKRVVLSDKIRDIRIASFYGCESLVKVKLPARLQTLSDNVFSHTQRLQKLDLPNTVYWIGRECFWLTAIKELRISEHARVANSAFLESNIKIECVKTNFMKNSFFIGLGTSVH